MEKETVATNFRYHISQYPTDTLPASLPPGLKFFDFSFLSFHLQSLCQTLGHKLATISHPLPIILFLPTDHLYDIQHILFMNRTYLLTLPILFYGVEGDRKVVHF